MATITINETHTGSTISNLLSAFGPNATSIYDKIVLSTVQSPVTAFITSYAFQNDYGYHNEEGPIFTLVPASLTALPLAITNTGISGISLSAHVGECAMGHYRASLALTLSSMALSATGLTATPVSAVTVNTPIQTISFDLTAVNLPYHHHLCRKRARRLQHLGYE